MGWMKRTSVKTGRRDLSHLLREGVTGTVMVSRTDDMVVLNLYGVLPPEEVGTGLVAILQDGIPSGFRPDGSMAPPLGVSASTLPPFMPRAFMASSGRCDVNRPGSPVYGTIAYRTEDAWPV
ncbi:MAG: hypothetical protein L0G94_07210 [Brachybacterium sp.]|uniref:hypothetical protein n=1 Tax=Brachybacterium sp. TaxID=1891286 RepID=UPI002647F3FF|nr:hypothetical protein [Brachybacterium sp.]MDN5686459.1 hypothetical protein [Brachybacterium sp.]